MIDLYTWGTPNGRKASIALEEFGLPYRVHAIDISKGEQHAPAYLAVNPNGKIPAIIDHESGGAAPAVVFESGAILVYLAEKTGRFLAPSGAERYAALQWLMWQMGGLGPMAGQVHHFTRAAPEQIPYAVDRYRKEVARLYGVLDRQLAAHEHVAGAYSIADMAIYPWVSRHEWHLAALADFAHVARWYETVGARPAVQKGMAVP